MLRTGCYIKSSRISRRLREVEYATVNRSRRADPDPLSVGYSVFVRVPHPVPTLVPRNSGPQTVVDRHRNTYHLSNGETVTRDRLRPIGISSPGGHVEI